MKHVNILRKSSVMYFMILLIFTMFEIFFTINYRVVHAGVESTKHNLSTLGPGDIKAVTETQICVFCHTPHRAETIPLWNHTLSQASYILPSSSISPWSSMLSTPQNPPDGDSRLCLSCHDGTVAVGSIVNLGGAPTTVSMHDTGTGYLTPGGMLSDLSPSFIGTDLSGHHPVSIEINDSLVNDKNAQCDNGYTSFSLLPFNVLSDRAYPVKLRPTKNMYEKGPSTGLGIQCSSCHDAHDNTYGNFLRLPYGSAQWEIDTTDLCTKCHLLCQ